MGYIRIDLPNPNNKWVEFGLANVETFIIRVGFGLANVDTIPILTRHEHDPSTRIVTPIYDSSKKKRGRNSLAQDLCCPLRVVCLLHSPVPSIITLSLSLLILSFLPCMFLGTCSS